MSIDLNLLPDQHGSLLLDLNEEPAYQQDVIPHLQEEQLYEDAAQVPDDGQENQLPDGEFLPDLNEALAYDQEDDIPHLQEGQPLQLHPELLHMHGIDLNVSVSEGEQEHLEGMMEDMPDYGVYSDAVDIVFDEEELDGSDFEEDHHANENNAPHSKNLTDTQRQQIYEALLARCDHGRLKRNATTIVAQMFQVSRYKVQRIWQRAKECHLQGRPVDVRSRKPKNSGRKRMQIDLTEVLTIPLHRRSTIRSLGTAIGVKKSTLHRWFKAGLLRRHSSTLKPLLTEQNKRDRLLWCLSMLDQQTLPHEPKFSTMDNIIHMDEKFFNITSKYKKYYLLPEEDDPHRTVQNKNCIGKVMFLAVVARPIYDDDGNCIFDGKIGVWAFVRKEPAKRRSRNRGRGTLVTKPIKVDRTTMRSYLIGKVLKAIVQRWPRELRGKTIWIQQDNAPSHVPVDDKDFAAAVAQTGLDIRLVNQPANSPDLNVLDLGFFASLQSLTYERISRNLDDLIQNVKNEFDNYSPDSLNRVFLTLQGCMIEVMKDGGGNRYKIPHIDKDRLQALGMLPKRLSCDRQLYEDVVKSLGHYSCT